MIKNLTKAFFSVRLWIFIGITLISVILMFIQPLWMKQLSALVITAFWLLPAVDWIYRFVIWLLHFITTNHTEYQRLLKPFATTKTSLLDKKRSDNEPFYWTIFLGISVIAIVMSLLGWVFQDISYLLVYPWIHTAELFLTFQISPWCMLLSIMFEIIFGIILFLTVKTIAKGELHDPSTKRLDFSKFYRIPVYFIGLWIRILSTRWLLGFSWDICFAHLVYWTNITLIIAGILVAINIISEKKNSTSNP